ncbi:MAG: NADH-quinone oxidoreductase subunit NuoE [Candidatus Saelkia tenebricola]|nr:NADH-quinone oxidoreductase subunit NuoE [Candidatus Saelkia tenebricola]
MKVNLSEAKNIIKKYCAKEGALIPLLQDVQAIYGYVPEEVVELISKELSIFPVEIYGVLTFYAQFYLTPRGKHTIKVCQGTACHVMGGGEILSYLSDTLGIREGETTEDGIFSLERVACLGCCGMAPVIMVDNDFYGKCTIKKMEDILSNYQKEKSI